MKKIIVISLSVILCINSLTFASIFRPENVSKYDLKNLSSDLATNYDYQNDCRGDNGPIRQCNSYQLSNDETNRDDIYLSFINALKKGDTKKAANIWNFNGILGGLYPDIVSNGQNSDLYAVPYHEGIIGFNVNGQEPDYKLFYISIKNGFLYKFKMDGSFVLLGMDKNGSLGYFKDSIKMVLYDKSKISYGKGKVTYPKSGIVITTEGSCTGDDERACTRSLFQSYITGKQNSKPLALWIKAFKSKVLKLFK